MEDRVTFWTKRSESLDLVDLGVHGGWVEPRISPPPLETSPDVSYELKD